MAIRTILTAIIAGALTAGAAAGGASAQDWDWGPDDRRQRELRGPGVPLLHPELRDTWRGRTFVLRNFDFDDDGRIDREEARAANRAFFDAAGPDGGRLDWDRYGRADGPPPQARGGGDWDREGMRRYRFRQGRYGAMFALQEVLFRTGSADLRPGAVSQLEALGDYLDANPRVRVRIDGHTDSVGTESANLALSRARAHSVAEALSEMNVDPDRIDVYGHGESSPVATNATAAGRQLNRRVEVTLIGQRASSFD